MNLIQAFTAWFARHKKPTAPTAQMQALPVYQLRACFLNTIEGCLLANGAADIYKAARVAFDNLPEDVREALQLSTNRGEWVERARLWQDTLYSALPPQRAAIAMQNLLQWYRRCVNIRIEKENKHA